MTALGAAALTRRDLSLSLRARPIIVMVINPLLFLLGFELLFGRLLGTPGTPYAQYLTPAIAALSALFVGQDAAGYLGTDRRVGLLARYRTMPIWSGSVLLGRLATDAVRTVGSVLVTLAVGALLGFRFTAGVPAALAFLLIAVGFGVALATIGAALGTASPRVYALRPVIFFPLLLLFQFSTAFVPSSGFPGWLRPIVANSPYSSVISALRALSSGGPTSGSVLAALAWIVGIAVVFGLIGLRNLRRTA